MAHRFLEFPIDRFATTARASQFCTVLIFLLPAMALTTHVSVGLIEAAILLSGLAFAGPLWHQRATLFGSARLVILAFAVNLGVASISLLSTSFDWRFMENPIKMLLAPVAIGLILLTRPRARILWIGLCVGTVGAAGFAVLQRFVLLMPRAEGFSMPITFGDLAMAMGLMSLAGIQQASRTRWAALPYLSFAAGVIASILSGSRGGWLALLLSFLPMYSYGRHALGRRTVVILAASIGLMGAASLLPQTGVRERLLDVSREITLYKNGNPDTSVGARLEMWKGAWTLFTEHPVVGIGRANYHLGMNDLIDRGLINPAMRDYHHAHNELLNALATQGLLGALALLALYAVPLRFFTRQLRAEGPHRPYALAGVLLVLSFIDFGLTQVMFAHHVSSAFYAVTVCVLVGLCLEQRRLVADAGGGFSDARTNRATG
ncbi:MAG: O-antigen ligase family protein [Herminiimonas sp.]|nr:O-antigen ligase family protein [Herminiimonas sp.]